ncbi:MAG: hypothetical protein J5832_00805, partial [Clostridia bacterium]|nr:hypothetical protein [Clostridia bacterium]
MKQHKSKVISLILILTMLVCAVPLEASAASSESADIGNELNNIRYEILAGTFDFGTEEIDVEKSIWYYINRQDKSENDNKYAHLTEKDANIPVRSMSSFDDDEYYLCFIETGNMITGLGNGVQAAANNYSSS